MRITHPHRFMNEANNAEDILDSIDHVMLDVVAHYEEVSGRKFKTDIVKSNSAYGIDAFDLASDLMKDIAKIVILTDARRQFENVRDGYEEARDAIDDLKDSYYRSSNEVYRDAFAELKRTRFMGFLR